MPAHDLWTGNYRELFPGASGGGSDPVVQSQELVGAARRHHQFGNSRVSRDPAAGQAASAPHVFVGEISNDVPFTPDLDGHKETYGRFPTGTAANSSHSQAANRAHFTGNRLSSLPLIRNSDGMPTTGSGSSAIYHDAQRDLNGLVSSALFAETLPPDLQFSQEAENVMVTPASSAPSRMPTGNLLTGEWTVPHLAGLGVGALVASSLVSKVF